MYEHDNDNTRAYKFAIVLDFVTKVTDVQAQLKISPKAVSRRTKYSVSDGFLCTWVLSVYIPEIERWHCACLAIFFQHLLQNLQIVLELKPPITV